MEIIVNRKCNNQISKGCHLQRFFKNKVYTGIEHQPLKRKVYRGKRDALGKRKNEIFYVNSDQSFRIQETLLIAKVNEILETLYEEFIVEQESKTKQSEIEHFEIINNIVLQKRDITLNEYKDFINDCLNKANYQTYKDAKLRVEVSRYNFKDIIEEIEVYETGIVCIFNNGLEMAVQF